MPLSRQRLLCVVLFLGLLLAVTFMSSWMLDASDDTPPGHPMVGGHLQEELTMERALNKEKQQQSTMSTELTLSTVKMTGGTKLTAVTKKLAKVSVVVTNPPISRAEAILNKKRFYHELTNLFGISLKDCSTYTFTERSCHEYKEMRFFNKSDEMYKQRVALASYPGSGNTWLRLTLEDATGVFTGAVYNDRTLRCTGFIGEGKNDYNAVLVVKTHEPVGEYDAVILLIRNPYRAMMSYHTWKVTQSHVKRAKTQHNMTIPSESFAVYFDKWVQLWSFNVWNAKAPYYIVEYEKLKANFEETLIGVLNFLQFPMDEEKLQCVVRNSYQQYHRPSANYSNPFSEEQKQQIESWISEHAEELERLSINYKAWVW